MTTEVRWAAGRTDKGLPIRRLHCFIPGYLRSLCKKRYAETDDLITEVEGTPLCVACERRADQRGLRIPRAALASTAAAAGEAASSPTESPDQVSVGGDGAGVAPGFVPGAVVWRQVLGGRTEHAFTGRRRSLCGRYVVEATEPGAHGPTCTPCARKAAQRS